MGPVVTELPDGTSRLARQSRLRRAAQRRRRFYILTGLSTLVPGAGLLLTRLRRVGVVIVGVTLVAGAALVVALLAGGVVDTALTVAVSPQLLTVALVALVLVGLAWSGAILVTAGQTRPADGRGALLRPAFVLACVAAVVTPLAYVGRDLSVQRSVVTEVFQPTVVAGSTPIATSGSEDPWAGTPRVNILLVGSDAGTDRWGVRTDSMMVASINTKTGDTVLIGVPRNLENVPIPQDNPLSTLYPNGYNCGDQCLMNGIWTLAVDHRDLFGKDTNPGLTSTRQVLEAVLGLTIKRSVVIDLRGFQSLVNAMGGVDITVRERVCVGCKSDGYGGIIWSTSTHQWIEKGPQHLNGYLALWYARSRATSDDFSRMRRQRCVAGALISQVNAATMVRRYPQLADALKKNVYTDITQAELPAWVDLIGRVQSGTIRSLPITDTVTPPGNPDFAKIRALVKTALKGKVATSAPSTTPSPTGTSTSGGTKRTPGASPSAPADDSLSSLTASC